MLLRPPRFTRNLDFFFCAAREKKIYETFFFFCIINLVRHLEYLILELLTRAMRIFRVNIMVIAEDNYYVSYNNYFIINLLIHEFF